MSPPERQPLAVSLHGIEPANFARCAVIRDWLADLGVSRVTLMVIPAADHHPFFQRSPELAEWLRERRAAGDAVAQQGFVADARRVPARDAAAHARAGRRLLVMAGLAPGGYRAQDLGHLLAARREIVRSYAWWVAPGLRRRNALRVDVHPDVVGRTARVRALERTLRAATERRESVTLDQLASPGFPAEAPRVLGTP